MALDLLAGILGYCGLMIFVILFLKGSSDVIAEDEAAEYVDLEAPTVINESKYGR